MRPAIVTGIVVVIIGLGIGVLDWIGRGYESATRSMLSEDAQLAIKLRCKNQTGRSADECRAVLTRVFLSGSLDPDRILRTYCDEVKQSIWGGGRPPAPKICVERYGGWRRG